MFTNLVQQRLNIADFSQIPLSGRQVWMPQNNLADSLYGSTVARRMCGGMPCKVMGSQMNTTRLPAYTTTALAP